MTVKIEDDPDYVQLKQLIERQTWMEAFDNLNVLLEKLPTRRMVQLAAAELKRSLPAFEELRSKIRWARQALDQMTNGDPVGQDFEFGQDVGGVNPIVTNFLDGLDKLDAASQEQDDPHVCAGNAARAILCAINARRYHYFGRVFPRDWRIVVKREAGVKDLPGLKSKFLEETAVQEFTTAEWRSLADALRRAFSR
jgi:hypothetical protein